MIDWWIDGCVDGCLYWWILGHMCGGRNGLWLMDRRLSMDEGMDGWIDGGTHRHTDTNTFGLMRAHGSWVHMAQSWLCKWSKLPLSFSCATHRQAGMDPVIRDAAAIEACTKHVPSRRLALEIRILVSSLEGQKNNQNNQNHQKNNHGHFKKIISNMY